MTMKKLKIRILLFDLLPKLPNTEVAFSNINIVEKNHPFRTQLWFPTFKIMKDSFVSVVSVNVQQINRTITEMRYCFVKSALH